MRSRMNGASQGSSTRRWASWLVKDMGTSSDVTCVEDDRHGTTLRAVWSRGHYPSVPSSLSPNQASVPRVAPRLGHLQRVYFVPPLACDCMSVRMYTYIRTNNVHMCMQNQVCRSAVARKLWLLMQRGVHQFGKQRHLANPQAQNHAVYFCQFQLPLLGPLGFSTGAAGSTNAKPVLRTYCAIRNPILLISRR
jgi:hypothetical protein